MSTALGDRALHFSSRAHFFECSKGVHCAIDLLALLGVIRKFFSLSAAINIAKKIFSPIGPINRARSGAAGGRPYTAGQAYTSVQAFSSVHLYTSVHAYTCTSVHCTPV